MGKDAADFQQLLQNQQALRLYVLPDVLVLNFAYLYKYYPENFRYMLEKMRETEELREKELGRPFSVISSNPKYNTDYLEHIVKTKWLKKLNEMECTTKQKNIAAAKNRIEIGG